MLDNYIGDSVKRTEDKRFLMGQGRYVDDIRLSGQTYCYFLRSPLAHAVIKSVDVAEAASMSGVVKILTAEDLESCGGVPCGWQITDSSGEAMREPKHPILAEGKVRHVGDPIAAVIAESLNEAKSAAEAIAVDLEELEPVLDMTKAQKQGVAVHADIADNLCFDWEFNADNAEAVKSAFAEAHHITQLEFVNNRLIANAMEPRAALSVYDTAEDRYTLYTTSQNPHVIRLLMGAFVLSIPEHKLRIVAPDVGGGFGSKIFHYGEEALLTFASKLIGRPIKWVCERTESFISDAQGRDHITKAELALDKDGQFLALRCDTLANMGAYLSTFAPCIPTWLHATLLAGQYKTPAILCRVRAMFTNTVPVDAYRGAGRPEATYLLERIIDKAAREMNISPVEMRRRNFIKASEFPYQTPVALEYDTGNYHATLDKVLQMADHQGFEARRQKSLANGKWRGIGLSCYIEACGIAPSALAGALGARAGLYEAAVVRVHPTGSVSVYTGSHSHGQGHETSFAQVIASKFGISMESVEIIHGDTDRIPFGMGTYGSRSLAVGGAALVSAADKIILKGKKIAAHLLEVSEDDIEFDDGNFKAKSSNASKSFGDIALAAYVPHQFPIETVEPGLEETSFYDPKNFTFPAGSYLCEVEVDPQTGLVSIESMWAADDFGNVVNPMIVAGQVHGGLAQGLGQALLENAVYDENGQLLSGSFMDYAVPRAGDMPRFDVDHSCMTPCTHNPLGVKGCGEAGAIGSPPALINAVLDALNQHCQVDDLPMPASPYRVWQTIQSATQR